MEEIIAEIEDINLDNKKKEDIQTTLRFDDETVLKKKMVCGWIEKKTFLNKKIMLQPVGMGRNKWGKECLIVKDGDSEKTIDLSGNNYNELLEILGPKISEWKNQTIYCKGESWEGEIWDSKTQRNQIKTGIKLSFLK